MATYLAIYLHNLNKYKKHKYTKRKVYFLWSCCNKIRNKKGLLKYSNNWHTLQGAKNKSNLLLKITWIANENRKLWVRVKTVITRKLIAINLVIGKKKIKH